MFDLKRLNFGLKILFVFAVFLSLASLSACRFADNKSEKPLIHHSLEDMTFVKGGTYMMGPSLPVLQVGNMVPVHKVRLSSFYVSRFNVDYEKYDLYTKTIGFEDANAKYKKDFFRSPKHPVDELTWQQANGYCKWLGEKTGLPYALPTEAQWEYVARNRGKNSWIFPTNDGTQKIGKNFPSFKQLSSQKHSYGGPAALPVGSIPCTPMGVCGLTGEVNQWMYDWYSSDYYSDSPNLNPQGPSSSKLKSIRGAGFNTDSPQYAHNYQRDGVNPSEQEAGFRCVINTDMPPAKFKAYIKKFEK